MRAAEVGDLFGAVLDGRYRLGSWIASGAMGHVFEATRLVDGSSVAIKLLQAESDDVTSRLRFMREAELLMEFEHPRVLNVFDLLQTDDRRPAMVMERLRGKTLEDLLRKHRRLPLPLVVRIGSQMMRALHYVHRQSVVHRDFKPQNIFLARGEDKKASVKLLDFGLALRLDCPNPRITQMGLLLGSPAYVAPEMLSTHAADTTKTDIYSAGIVLFRMLTGSHPFVADNVDDMLRAHVETEPRVPDWASLRVPEEVGDFVMRCLAKDPAERPASVGRMFKELLEVGSKLA